MSQALFYIIISGFLLSTAAGWNTKRCEELGYGGGLFSGSGNVNVCFFHNNIYVMMNFGLSFGEINTHLFSCICPAFLLESSSCTLSLLNHIHGSPSWDSSHSSPVFSALNAVHSQ